MKTTITLEGEQKIRQMLERSLMLTDVRDYASDMACFYWEKAQDLLKAMGAGFEKEREEAHQAVYGKYREIITGEPADTYAVRSALDNFRKAHCFVGGFEGRVKAMVKDLTLNPLTAEYEDADDEVDAWLDIDMRIWNRFADDILKGTALGNLWGDSTGFGRDSEYKEMLDLYLGEDRR